MPVGACDSCGRYFILESGAPADRDCPHCGQALRLSQKTELLRRLREPLLLTAAREPTDPRCAEYAHERKVFTRLTERAEAVRTQIRSRRDEVSARVVEARRLREQMRQLLDELRTRIDPPGTRHAP